MTARSNGLRANTYAVLIEIEESLGDQMLGALAERNIAAYVVPAPGPGGTTRLILHVDALRRVPAGIVLAGLTPALAGELPSDGETPADNPSAGNPAAGPSPTGSTASLADGAAFAAIVAGFHRVPMERTWPEAEDLPPEPVPPASQPAAQRPPNERRRPAVPPTSLAKAGEAVPDDEEEHYEPPTLPKLEPHPPVTRWALIAMGLGLALLLLPTIFAFGHRTSLDVAGVLCVLGATAVLVSRLRERSADDPDDGAVV